MNVLLFLLERRFVFKPHLVINVVCHFTALLKKGLTFKLDGWFLDDVELFFFQKMCVYLFLLYTLIVQRCLQRRVLWIWIKYSFIVFYKNVPSFESFLIFKEPTDVSHVRRLSVRRFKSIPYWIKIEETNQTGFALFVIRSTNR